VQLDVDGESSDHLVHAEDRRRVIIARQEEESTAPTGIALGTKAF
jgi:hypothetical protein